jgi:hypothetical protein
MGKKDAARREVAELEAKIDSYRQKVKALKAAAQESADDAERWKAKAKEHKRRSAESREAARKALEVAVKAEKQARKAQKKARKALAATQHDDATLAPVPDLPDEDGADFHGDDETPLAARALQPAVLAPADDPYATWSLTRLRAEARAQGVSGYSRMPREQLLLALGTR